MEIIDNKSGDDSSLPPLSDGRSSPAEELNDLDETRDGNDLVEPAGRSEQTTVNILNDLNSVTLQSCRPQSPVHTTQQAFPPAATPDLTSSVAPDTLSATPTHDDRPEAASYEATLSATAPLAPIVLTSAEPASDNAIEPLSPASVPPAAPVPSTPTPSLSGTFSGHAPDSLTTRHQGEAGLTALDNTTVEHLYVGPVTPSSIGHTSDDIGDSPIPQAASSAPASTSPMPNASDNIPAPPTLSKQGEAALLTVETSVEAPVTSFSFEHTFNPDDVALPQTGQPSAGIHAITSTVSPQSDPSPNFDTMSTPAELLGDLDEAILHSVGSSSEAQAAPASSFFIEKKVDHGDKSLPPTAQPTTSTQADTSGISQLSTSTSDNTSAPPIIRHQNEFVLHTVGPSTEAQADPSNSTSGGHTVDNDEKSLLQPTTTIPADSSAVTPLPLPPVISDGSPALQSLCDQGETVPHTFKLSAENQFAPISSSPTGRIFDHSDRSSPQAVPSDIPTVNSSAPPSHPKATFDPTHSVLSIKGESGIESAADKDSASVTPSAINQQPQEDVHSSTYPPSSSVGEREAVMSSEISSSVHGPPVIQNKGTTMSAKLNNSAQVEPTDLKYNNLTEPRSFQMEDNEKEAVKHETPVISSNLQAPDRRYHSRARLDSLEDRNNLDTDSEMQLSSSESEKESDMEDHPGPRTTRRRQKRSRRSSTSISSSEDERDPFLERRNDLSIVSSPEHELPHDGGGFGISLSAGEGIVKKHKEWSTSNDQMPPPNVPQLQRLELSTTGNLSEYTDKYKGRNLPEEVAVHVDSTLTVSDQIESKEIGLLTENQDLGGFQTQHGRMMGARSQEESSELHDTIQLKPPLSQQETYAKEQLLKPVSKVEPYQSLSDPGPSSQHVHSWFMPTSEEQPMRTEPANQVTRTSDPVLESTSSSSDQLQPPVRKSFSSHPPSIPPSLDRVDHLPRLPTPPVSSSAPSTFLHSMLDQPPPPFTHYAAPPPIFRAHVLEQRYDPVYTVSVVEDKGVGDTADQGSSEEKETAMDIEQKHSIAGTGMEGHTGHGLTQDSLIAHHSYSNRSTISTSHLIDVPPMVCKYADIYMANNISLFLPLSLSPSLHEIQGYIIYSLTTLWL